MGGYPPELSIRNIEVWLDWWAHQLDTPHWWVELTAIPNVENPKRLEKKIHASFLILVVRCEAFPGQGYTAPPPKCLTRNMILPNDPSFQDIWQQPLLLTVAYAQELQYWAEKFRLPVHPDYCPLVMSIVKLMQCVKEHITFYKWDILWGLGTQPTTTSIRGMESNPAEAWGHMIPSPHCSDLHSRGRPHHSNLLPHQLWMMWGILHLALWTLCQRGMLQSFQPNLKGKPQRTCQLVRPLVLLRR